MMIMEIIADKSTIPSQINKNEKYKTSWLNWRLDRLPLKPIDDILKDDHVSCAEYVSKNGLWTLLAGKFYGDLERRSDTSCLKKLLAYSILEVSCFGYTYLIISI
jgi:hypothetical protein